jgi:hypothetical protein
VQQQAFRHVSNDLGCLKVGFVDEEKTPECGGQSGSRTSSLGALKGHFFAERTC